MHSSLKRRDSQRASRSTPPARAGRGRGRARTPPDDRVGDEVVNDIVPIKSSSARRRGAPCRRSRHRRSRAPAPGHRGSASPAPPRSGLPPMGRAPRRRRKRPESGVPLPGRQPAQQGDARVDTRAGDLAAIGQQRQRAQPDRRDGAGAADPVGDPVGQPLHERAVLAVRRRRPRPGPAHRPRPRHPAGARPPAPSARSAGRTGCRSARGARSTLPAPSSDQTLSFAPGPPRSSVA